MIRTIIYEEVFDTQPTAEQVYAILNKGFADRYASYKDTKMGLVRLDDRWILSFTMEKSWP